MGGLPTRGSSHTATGRTPDFKRPPVVEVAISVHFDELGGFQPVHFGMLYDRLKDRYPKTEYHPPVGPTIELFDTKGAPNVAFRFDTSLPVGRCWYLNEAGTELLQVQPDRVTLNWRKLDTDAAYPHYDALKVRFERELGLVLGFFEELGLGTFQPLQCELTYVNHIIQGDGWNAASDIGQVVSLWSGAATEDFLPPAEDVRFACQFRMDDQGVPRGRLHVELQSALRAIDRRKLLALHMVARGAPLSGNVDGVLGFADQAHTWIVRGFAAITTTRMHQLWGRIA